MIGEAVGHAERLASGLVITRTGARAEVFLVLHGEIDCASAPAFLTRLRDEIDQCDDPIVLDFAQVTFMDSSAISALLRARASAGARLRLGPLHPSVRRVLQMTAVADLFVNADGFTGADRGRDIS